MARRILRTLEELLAMLTVENIVFEVSVDNRSALLMLVFAEGTSPDLALDFISSHQDQ